MGSPDRYTPLSVTQWAQDSQGNYTSCYPTVPTVPAGVYKLRLNMFGQAQLVPHILTMDEIVLFPDSPAGRAVDTITRFRIAAPVYASMGLLHKRGIIMYGPQGTGKTVTVGIIANQATLAGCVSVYVDPNVEPRHLTKFLREFRLVEGNQRVIIMIFEEMDTLLANFGDSEYVRLLDGEDQIPGVVYLATTNHPDRFPARFINRPGRFDERIYVGPMTKADRAAYLTRKSAGGLSPESIDAWATASDGFSVAHLKELIIGVMILGKPFGDEITRLQGMFEKPKGISGFAGEGATTVESPDDYDSEEGDANLNYATQAQS